MSMRTEVYQIRGNAPHYSHFGKTSQRMYVARGEIGQKFNRLPELIMWPEVRQKTCKAAQNRAKTRITRSQNSILLDDLEDFALLILMTKKTKNLSKTRGENWKDLWQRGKPCKREAQTSTTKSGCKGGNCTPKESQNDLWLNSGILMNPQSIEWTHLNRKIMKITLVA